MSHQQNQELISALAECAAACNHCAIACVEENDAAMLKRCISLDLDCADICSMAIGFIARGSEHAQHILNECAEICGACAQECDKHASHMDHCKDCAEACRKCADLCQTGAHA